MGWTNISVGAGICLCLMSSFSAEAAVQEDILKIYEDNLGLAISHYNYTPDLASVGIIFDKPAAEVETLYQQADTGSDLASYLVMMSLASGKSMKEINQLWNQTPGYHTDAAIMFMSAIRTGVNMTEMKKLWDQTPSYFTTIGDADTQAILVDAAASGGLTMSTVLKMRDQGHSGYKNTMANAMLVQTAVLSGKTMQEISELLKQAPGEASVALVTAAALSGKPMTYIKALWESAAGGSWDKVSLVMSAALSGRSIEEINGIFETIQSRCESCAGPMTAAIVGRDMLKKNPGKGVPLIYVTIRSRGHNRGFYSYFHVVNLAQ